MKSHEPSRFWAFSHERTILFRNTKTFPIKKFRKEPTYLHFPCNTQMLRLIYYVGCLHKLKHTYIKWAVFAHEMGGRNVYWLKDNLFRLTFPMRNFLFLGGNKLFHRGNTTFWRVVRCQTTFRGASGALKTVVFWVKKGEMAECFWKCRQPT